MYHGKNMRTTQEVISAPSMNVSLDSAVNPKVPEAKRNLGAAKASDCEVSKCFALSHAVAMRREPSHQSSADR